MRTMAHYSSVEALLKACRTERLAKGAPLLCVMRPSSQGVQFLGHATTVKAARAHVSPASVVIVERLTAPDGEAYFMITRS